MKPKLLLLPFIFLLAACSNPEKREEQPPAETTVPPAVQKDTFSNSHVQPSIVSRNNPDFTYALYLPRQNNDSARLPVIIFCDPHGDGSFPVTKYHSLAEKFGVILIGSNDIKNGLTFNQTTPILQLLVSEASTRFHADNRQISLAGFSGGAKAVLVAATETPSILSIIYCGAGISQLTGQLPPSLGIAGLKDMNYTEVVALDAQMDNQHVRHAIIEWNGRHEWSDSSIFQDAFYWVRFRAMEKNYCTPDMSLVQTFIRQNYAVLSDPLKEKMRLKKVINFLSGVADVTSFQLSLMSHINTKKFIAAEAADRENLEVETRMKQNYFECLEQKDVLWWHGEISRIRNLGRTDAGQRIIGYISLACYSLSSSTLKQGDLKKAEKYLSIYSLVDPDNADRAYLQAGYYALTRNDVGAIQSLREAVNLGFSDKSKLQNDDLFSSIRNSSEFNEVVQSIK